MPLLALRENRLHPHLPLAPRLVVPLSAVVTSDSLPVHLGFSGQALQVAASALYLIVRSVCLRCHRGSDCPAGQV